MRPIRLPHKFYDELKASIQNSDEPAMKILLTKTEENYTSGVVSLMAEVLQGNGITSKDLKERFDEIFEGQSITATLISSDMDNNKFFKDLQKAVYKLRYGRK